MSQPMGNHITAISVQMGDMFYCQRVKMHLISIANAFVEIDIVLLLIERRTFYCSNHGRMCFARTLSLLLRLSD